MAKKATRMKVNIVKENKYEQSVKDEIKYPSNH